MVSQKKQLIHILFPRVLLDKLNRSACLRGLSKSCVVRDLVGKGLVDWERENRDLIDREEVKNAG